jgi:hypothetical protein
MLRSGNFTPGSRDAGANWVSHTAAWDSAVMPVPGIKPRQLAYWPPIIAGSDPGRGTKEILCKKWQHDKVFHVMLFGKVHKLSIFWRSILPPYSKVTFYQTTRPNIQQDIAQFAVGIFDLRHPAVYRGGTGDRKLLGRRTSNTSDVTYSLCHILRTVCVTSYSSTAI